MTARVVVSVGNNMTFIHARNMALCGAGRWAQGRAAMGRG